MNSNEPTYFGLADDGTRYVVDVPDDLPPASLPVVATMPDRDPLARCVFPAGLGELPYYCETHGHIRDQLTDERCRSARGALLSADRDPLTDIICEMGLDDRFADELTQRLDAAGYEVRPKGEVAAERTRIRAGVEADLRAIRTAFDASWAGLYRIAQSSFTMAPRGDGFAEGYESGLREARGIALVAMSEAYEAFGSASADLAIATVLAVIAGADDAD